MANFLGTPKFQAFDSNGDPLSGGKLYSYISGTTTAKATYPTLADAEAGTNANANPVILDSRGEANVVLTGSYKLVLKTSADSQLWSVDAVGTTSNTLLNDVYGNDVIVLASGGSSSVNYITLTNSTAGNPPLATASGTDTNIDLKIASKGSGTLKLDAGATGTVDVGTVSTGAINLKRNTAVTGTLSTSGAATLNSAEVSTTLGVTGASTLASVGVTGAATVGTTLGVTGDTTLSGTLATGAVTLNSTINTFTFPSSDGSANYVLATNGSKVLSFVKNDRDADKPAFRAYVGTTQNITSGLNTKIELTAETFDTASAFDSTTNYRFTPQVAGYYSFVGCISGNLTSLTTGSLILYKNGSIAGGTGFAGTAGGAVFNAHISDLIFLNGSTDYIEMFSSIVGTGTIVIGASSTQSYLTGILVKAT